MGDFGASLIVFGGITICFMGYSIGSFGFMG